jgi:chromosome partitioning protein
MAATAKVIAAANLKGGAGKSTTTINLAAAAQLAGIRAAIIDIDPEQQAAARWHDSRTLEHPLVMSGVYSRLPQAIAEMEKAGAQLVLIDCPAFVQPPTNEALKVCDLVLIPCRTTAFIGDCCPLWPVQKPSDFRTGHRGSVTQLFQGLTGRP